MLGRFLTTLNGMLVSLFDLAFLDDDMVAHDD